MYFEYVHSSNYYPTNYAVVPWIPPSTNQVVSSSHGLFPWIGNWFGLKFLLQPLIWLVKKILHGSGDLYKKIADEDPVILFFKKMHCVCKKFLERYIAEQESYEKLEMIINNENKFVFADLSLVDKYYDDIRKHSPDKKIPASKDVLCSFRSSALHELEISKHRVKTYLDGLNINLNLTDQEKSHLIVSLEIIIKHLQFIGLFLSFEKIQELEENIFDVSLFSKKTDHIDDKDKQRKDLNHMFEDITRLQIKKQQLDQETKELEMQSQLP